MVKIDAISFDFFQTIACHSRESGRGRALTEYLESKGFRPDPWEHKFLYDVLEPHAREYSPEYSLTEKAAYFHRLTNRVFERFGLTISSDEAVQHSAAIWDLIGPSSLGLYPDVPGALRDLRNAGYRLILVSNWQCGLGQFCTEMGIRDHFEHVLASAEIGCEKPDREIFSRAANLLSLPPERVLHIGDSPADDIEGARAAGMHALLIDRAGVSRDGDEFVIGSLHELRAFLGTHRPEIDVRAT